MADGAGAVDGSRRRFLGRLAGLGSAIGTSRLAMAPAGAQERRYFYVGGKTAGWMGRSGPIEGTKNPTLKVLRGNTYVFVWQNVDGVNHNVAIRDADRNNIVETEIMADRGAHQRLEFTATEAMAEYYCEVHPGTMQGEIEIVDGPSESNAVDTISTPTPTPEATPTPSPAPTATPSPSPTAAPPTGTPTQEPTEAPGNGGGEGGGGATEGGGPGFGGVAALAGIVGAIRMLARRRTDR